MAVKKTINKSLIQKIVVFAFWLATVLICIINRDKITVDAIVNFTPENTLVAILLILLLFAFKSITVLYTEELSMQQAELCFRFLLQ